VLSSVLWLRTDGRGAERCTLETTRAGYRLTGTCVTAYNGMPAKLEYAVATDDGWRTRSVELTMDRAGVVRELRLEADGEGRWIRDGRPLQLAESCRDVDLSFTPATNTLAIRRLGLEPGQSGEVRALWVIVPAFDLQVVDQVYERLDERAFRYRSPTASALLAVDEHGIVLEYEDRWHAAASSARSDEVDGVARPPPVPPAEAP
jgi:hypothetical protein